MAGGGVPRVRWQVAVAKAMAGGRGGDGDGGDGGSDGDGGSGGGGGADEPESRRSGHGAVRRAPLRRQTVKARKRPLLLVEKRYQCIGMLFRVYNILTLKGLLLASYHGTSAPSPQPTTLNTP